MYAVLDKSQPNRALELLSAIAVGHAVIEDIAAELRREGIESLEELLTILNQGIKDREADQANAQQPVDFKNWRKKTPQELISHIEQRVPEVPFLLNGTLYDPKDIKRFNGQELHFVVASAGDHMLVVDDRDLIADWWQFAYFEQFKNKSGLAQAGGDMRYDPPHSTYWEHNDFLGSAIVNILNRGWKNLRNVPMGLFSNWNDKISSVALSGTSTLILHEHINWTGQTLTLNRAQPNLHPFGWNDRASSTETF